MSLEAWHAALLNEPGLSLVEFTWDAYREVPARLLFTVEGRLLVTHLDRALGRLVVRYQAALVAMVDVVDDPNRGLDIVETWPPRKPDPCRVIRALRMSAVHNAALFDIEGRTWFPHIRFNTICTRAT